MIIVHLSDGLGNQMFQYAAGLALSVYHNSLLLLDVGDFAKYDQHNGFELARVFSVPVLLARQEDIRKLLGWQSGIRIRLRLAHNKKLHFLRRRHFIFEPGFRYWRGIRNIESPFYMMGYWQSERYFADIEPRIRDNFTFRQPLSGYNREIAQKIDEVNAVSIHIRRGDYADEYRNLRQFGLCPLSYYEEAIQFITDRVNNPFFFVFSDDMDWVRANLKIKSKKFYVDNNRGSESYNDMRLMSTCKHHIIANSTFGWWGAWLNPSTDKIVIAPKQWFTNCSAESKGILPEEWVKL